MSNPKNIQEYVAERVIEHMKYLREADICLQSQLKYKKDKIKKLKEILNDFGIYKCQECKEYKDERHICRCCTNTCCYECSEKCGKLENYSVYLCRVCCKGDK